MMGEMEEADSSSRKSCEICSTSPPKYTCPRCGIAYCSMDCYKSTQHLDCSEEFYKECVTTEMKCQSEDPEKTKQMNEILKRVYEQNADSLFEDYENFDSSNELDSDDDDDVPDLADRIKNVNLDDADEIWAVLTDAERQEFEAILRNGDETKLLPQWTPWWSIIDEKKLVEEIDEERREKIIERCPKILEIEYIPAVEKASPTVSFNLLNILHAYVITTCHYAGDYQSFPGEAVGMFLQLCDTVGDNKVFENEESTLDAVMEKAYDYKLLTPNEKEVMINYLRQIIQGPNNDDQSFYMCAALSDLHYLFGKAKKEVSRRKESYLKPTFTSKFKAHIDREYLNLSKKCIPLYLKKFEYYFVWASKYGKQMTELKVL